MRLGSARAFIAAGVAAMVAGCGSYAPAYPPQGIDELTIPMSSIDPDQFVDVVDNAWLGLDRGNQRWLTSHGERTVAVQPSEYAGVETVRVESSWLTGSEESSEIAQDRDGNVWQLAQGQAWLVLTSTPRLGDGYRSASGEISEVTAVGTTAVTDDRTWEDAVQITRTRGDDVSWHWFVEGVGEVLIERANGTTWQRVAP